MKTYKNKRIYQGAQIRSIKNIFKVNLNTKKSEKILVFTDDVNKELQDVTEAIAETGKKYVKTLHYVKHKATGSHGAEPPETVWNTAFGKTVLQVLEKKNLLSPLLKKEIEKTKLTQAEKVIKQFKKEAVNAVVALSYYSTSHTNFRRLLTNICRTRYVSMPLFDRQMLEGAMSVDWHRMAERTENITKRVNRKEKIKITTPNGTHLTLSKKGRKAEPDTGIVQKPGSFSNLPAGEVYLAPLEGSAEGRLVLEWAPTRKLREPIILLVRNGTVKRVLGGERYAGYLRNKLRERKENANIAELGIGTNDRASRPDNILESEKIMGTVHIALGDNSTFGGTVSTPFHQDFVFFKPTLTLISKSRRQETLLKDGNLL
jgi:leucyl aminopeptidase (aminopeptidase T)